MSRNNSPYEVIGGAPIAIYHAPVGTAFPTLDEDVDTNDWTLLGKNGDLNYDGGGGIEVGHPQSINKWRAYGEAGSRKAFRTDEDTTFKVMVVDLRLETLSIALNGNDVTEVAAGPGTVGYKKIGLSRGLDMDHRAYLVRLLASPYGDGDVDAWIGQYEFPRAIMTGSPTKKYMKGEPVGLELTFDSLVDETAADESERAGRLIFQTSEAGT